MESSEARLLGYSYEQFKFLLDEKRDGNRDGAAMKVELSRSISSLKIVVNYLTYAHGIKVIANVSKIDATRNYSRFTIIPVSFPFSQSG